jgi:hypothetical protein
VLLVVGDQIIEGKPIVTIDEVHAVDREMTGGFVDVSAAGEARTK